jgi:NIMA (never in mitosis gene a)-related kinase
VHSRKILHRDLKSQNVFLTRVNTVKLGDFGISKVLESTMAQANTVQGTPYYMSPEVCQNRPYTYQSDIWALGCILYELCTLKYPFFSDNLLSLAVKIVQEKPEPIPSRYSPELSQLINLLLSKDESIRPRVIDIIHKPFVKHHMELFVKSQNK